MKDIYKIILTTNFANYSWAISRTTLTIKTDIPEIASLSIIGGINYSKT